MIEDEQMSLRSPTGDATTATTTGDAAGAPNARETCPACRRVNPPARMNCLYCGESLPHAQADIHISLPPRAPEAHEQGFNVVLLPTDDAAAEGAASRAGMPPVVSAEVGRLLGVAAEKLARMLTSDTLVPLARVRDEEEARAIARRLAAFSLHIAVIADEELRVRSEAVKRVRRLELDGGALRLWCRGDGDEADAIELAEVVALVRGRLFAKRIESAPAPRPDAPLADERETFSDQNVLDIYAASPVCTWRVEANSFDYSCLGARRTLLARDNFELLVEALRLAAGTARFDDSYAGVRPLLDDVWALDERTDARGRVRLGVGRFATQTALHVRNDDQFTCYSRARAHLERVRLHDRPERAEDAPPTNVPCR